MCAENKFNERENTLMGLLKIHVQAKFLFNTSHAWYKFDCNMLGNTTGKILYMLLGHYPSNSHPICQSLASGRVSEPGLHDGDIS